jgi:uncharacterized membrane protein
MQKEELLQLIKQAALEQIISKEEVANAYDQGISGLAGAGITITAGTEKTAAKEDGLTKKMNFSDILYYVGGFIVFLGIAVLIGQNWDDLGKPARIIATFGSAVAAYITGVLFFRQEKFESIGQAFHLIAALVFPVGIMVIFDSMNIDVNGSGVQSWVSLILLATYIASFVIFRKNLFIIFSLIFGTWFFYAINNFLFSNTFDWEKQLQYLTLAVGMSYLFLGYYFSKTEDKKGMQGFLYGFGSLFFLGAAFSLGGYDPDQNMFWELIYPGILFGMIFLGVFLKSRGILIFSILFLMVYIMKLTFEYFSDSLGWPLSLVIVGLALIFSGYYAVYLNKKYISSGQKS